MAQCPKCDEPNLKWLLTKNKKHWLKKDLGDGQTAKDWHQCDESKIKDNPKLRPFCHKCKAKLISCKECINCEYGNGFCPICKIHVIVMMK